MHSPHVPHELVVEGAGRLVPARDPRRQISQLHVEELRVGCKDGERINKIALEEESAIFINEPWNIGSRTLKKIG